LLEVVGNNNKIERLQVGHNVSQSDTQENRDVTRDVAIVAGKDSRQMNISRNDEFINSNKLTITVN